MTATETQVREKPILFSGEMVRAILEGRKTQTRRVISDQPMKHPGGKYEPHDPFVHADGVTWGWMSGVVTYTDNDVRCPWGKAGDRLYVRETWSRDDDWLISVFYRADDSCYTIGHQKGDQLTRDDHPERKAYRPKRWKPSIHMPRWASRLTLDILDVRVERLNEISEADAVAEGMTYYDRGRDAQMPSAHEQFHALWDSLNADRGYGWDRNPWVWAITFKRIDS